jgi:dephospho-CoA kinase
MIKVGITGGIGSGKSVVCDIFKILGCKIYYADLRARILTETNPEIKLGIQKYFGHDVYEDGILQRKVLAGKVFSNPTALQQLNNIIHPIVFQDFEDWTRTYQNEKYIIKEAAIMFESGANKLLDTIITVYSPLETRIERVMKRDAISREATLERIKNQMDDEEKIKLSNFIIYNNNSHSLIKQVLELHKMLSK